MGSWIAIVSAGACEAACRMREGGADDRSDKSQRFVPGTASHILGLRMQAALLEEKTDAVKEYIAWRKLPRELSLRIKKHFSFFYTRRAAFDEVELLNGLSPSLRSEVTRFVLKETLGRIPLFSQQLDPDFQLEVFPLLKPVSYEKARCNPSSFALIITLSLAAPLMPGALAQQGEIVMRRGEPSRDLLFLLTGAIHFLSSIDQTVDSVFTPIEETFLVRHHLAVEHGVRCLRSSHTLAHVAFQRRHRARSTSLLSAILNVFCWHGRIPPRRSGVGC